MSDTRIKILDTAERLFGEEGYQPVSLRHITAAAEVNLASIHYHFGSKEELLDALIERRATPVNEERMAGLRRLKEAAGPNPIAIEDLLEAFLVPAFHSADRHPGWARLMGRLHAEGVMPAIARKYFSPVGESFFSELRRTLPGLPEDELAWRTHFAIGAMAHALTAPPLELPLCDAVEPPSDVARRMVAFLSGGFRAPLPAHETVEVKR